MKMFESSLESPPSRETGIDVTRRTRSVSPVPTTVRLKSILVPVDFSSPSAAALDEAARMAQKFGARLTLVHVVEKPEAEVTNGRFRLVFKKGQVVAGISSRLKSLAQDWGVDARLVEETVVLEGQAFFQICELARKLNSDLITIATRGYTGLKHMMLGSTAERVVRYAPCPVLIARNHQSQRDGQGKLKRLTFRKIVVPIDFSSFSTVAMNYASAFAREFDAERIFLHAVYPKYYFTGSEVDLLAYAKLLDDCQTVAEKQMRELVRQRRMGSKKISGRVRRGHPVTAILDEAEEAGADLIVIPTHGRTGFKRAWLGSVTENVVRLAHCDVLVVREREHDFVG